MTGPVEQWDCSYREGSYNELWHLDQPNSELVSLIATGIVPHGASLDLGCGAGVEAIYLASQGFAAHGLDLSPAAVRIARRAAQENDTHVEFQCASVLALPFRAGLFTLITDRGVMHHIPEEDRPRYAVEVARVAKPGGFFLLRGARNPEQSEFIPLRPDVLAGLFATDFVIGPIQEMTGHANVGTLDMYLAVMRRKA